MFKRIAAWSLLIIELGFLIVLRPTDLEMFSFLWGMIAFMALLYSFSSNSKPSVGFGFNDATKYGAATMAMLESEQNSKNTTKKPQAPITNRVVYIIAIVLNVILYISS